MQRFRIVPGMNRTQRLLRISVLAAALLALAAFQAAAATKLTLFTMPHNNWPVGQEALVKAWKQAHPEYADVEVEIVAGWVSQLQVMHAGGAPPDVIFYISDEVVNYAINGILMNLTPFIEREGPEFLSTFIPGTLVAGTYKGKPYLLPLDLLSTATVYYEPLFLARGVEVPSDDWTWNDLLEIGKKLTYDSNGDNYIDQFGFADEFRSSRRWPVWVWGAGGDFYNTDLTRSLLDSEEALSGIEFYLSLFFEHHIAPRLIDDRLAEPGVETRATGIPSYVELFETNRVAMMNNTRGGIKSNHQDYGVLPLPKGKARTTINKSSGYGIHPSADDPEIAWSLIKYAVSPAAFKAITDPVGGEQVSSQLELARELLLNAPEQRAINWVTASLDAKPSTEIEHPVVGGVSIPWNDIARGTVPVRTAVREAVAVHNAAIQQAIENGLTW